MINYASIGSVHVPGVAVKRCRAGLALAALLMSTGLSIPAQGQMVLDSASPGLALQPVAEIQPVLSATTQPELSADSRPVAVVPAERNAVAGTQPTTRSAARPAATAPVNLLLEAEGLYPAIEVIEILVAVQSAATQPVATQPVVAEVARSDEKVPSWTHGLKEAVKLAQQSGRPVLVRAGAPWCGWCRRLEAEIGRPEVRKELARWTLAYLDVDRDSEEAESLGIGLIPALRVLTSTGRVVASQDGYMEADALVAWLGQQFDQASIVAPRELGDDAPPDAAMLARLLKQFDHRDPVIREAAIRRLAPHPDVAAAAVVNAFSDGKLAVRLTALELLEAWNAPIRGMDPWQPATIPVARLEQLKAWASQPGKTPATRPADLDESQLASAREELAAYLKAGNPTEVLAIRERLARYGPALLPEVLDALKAVEDDATRERLGALRYRLAASDALALSWPGGFERLASLSVAMSQQAAEELTARATDADVPLLLELFSHPDPLMRETVLRALQTIGGAQTIGALVKLLRDPEPNVRAAVLKQLAEKPNRQLVPRIAEYVKTETDADLVVHAVRFLREARGEAAVNCLVTLLSHESWRVRAEAAEALGQSVGDMNSLSAEKRADAYAALIKLLDDPDGFVVSRAVAALGGSDLAAAVEPLSQAAVKHPELAEEIAQMLARMRGRSSAGAAHLRSFLKHGDARVRAGAITSLASAEPLSIGEELRTALEDQDRSVRIAAAGALMEVVEYYRNTEGARRIERPVVVRSRRSLLGALFGGRGSVATTQPDDAQPASQPSGGSQEPELDPQSKWLLAFRAGQDRPQWMNALIPPLETMLAADVVEERMAAALPLIALGADEQALPLLMVEATTTPTIQSKAIAALPWLPWEKRLELFTLLLQLDSTPERLNELAAGLAKVPDPRAADPLWDLLARPEFNDQGATGIYQALLTLYVGEYQYNPSMIPPPRRVAATAAARRRIEGGTPIQRVVGLAILLTVAREEAGRLAKELLEDPATAGDPQLRRDAGQVWLLADTGERVAVEALSSDSPDLRRMALLYLAFGRSHLQVLRNHIPVVMSFHEQEEYLAYSARTPIEPKAPEGLSAQAVRPFLKDPDAKIVACAGYLLALLGEAEGLPPLIAYWRGNARNDSTVFRLVYRAIAALGDDAQTPVLEEIYRQFEGEDYRIREFYWTIRTMKGPECLKLRERIRREVGTENLR